MNAWGTLYDPWLSKIRFSGCGIYYWPKNELFPRASVDIHHLKVAINSEKHIRKEKDKGKTPNELNGNTYRSFKTSLAHSISREKYLNLESKDESPDSFSITLFVQFGQGPTWPLNTNI